MSRAEVSDTDRKDFQRWLAASTDRRRANSGRTKRPEGRRRDHGEMTTGSVEIGKELDKSMPLALAALVLHGGGESDPLSFIHDWVGPYASSRVVIWLGVVLLVGCGRGSALEEDSFPTWTVGSVPLASIGGDDQRSDYLLYRVVGATRLSDGR